MLTKSKRVAITGRDNDWMLFYVRRMRILWVVLVLVACGKSKSESNPAAKPSASPTGAAAGAPAPSAGGCSHVAICTVVPIADLNAKLGLKVTDAKPGSHEDGGRMGDGCEYSRAGVHGRDANIGRICIPDAAEAKMTIDATMSEQAKEGQQRHDLKLGDRAYYIADPSLHRIDMMVASGNVLLTLEDVQVEAGQEAAAADGLGALASALLKK